LVFFLFYYIIRKDFCNGTVFRGIAGFGKHSHFHTTSILQLSTDLPILVEIADLEEKIDTIKPKLDEIITQGLIT
jgi:PII-like signaling protein